MSTALDASDYIYQGCWINWSKGRLLGSTITLTSTNSTLLTNILAVFVTIAGGQFWTILRFALHQLRASQDTDRQSNTFYHKEQVVLRNTTSSLNAAQLLLKLRWESRRNVRSASHNIPLVVIAVLSAAFFFVAAAFSNTLTNAGPQVLSRSPFCGFWNQTYLDIAQDGIDAAMGSVQNMALANEANAKRNQNTELSLQYAQGCYLGQSTESSNCDTFQSSALAVTMTNESSCHFSAEVCRSGVDTVVFDTGLINTHTDLGINAAPSDRLSFRRVTNCTVLDNANLTTGWINQSATLENGQPTWKITYANFGPSLVWQNFLNETYSYTNFAEFYTNFAGDWSMSYQLAYDYACGINSDPLVCSSTFDPIPALATSLSNADLNLLYLGYTGIYIDVVDDPWFSAHQPYHINTTSIPFLQKTYARDKPISTLACTEQHQICSEPTTCTPLLGYSQVLQYVASHISLTPNQNITLSRIAQGLSDASILEIAQTFTSISVPLLASSKTLVSRHTFSLPLPPDQWKAELAYWQAISLAQLQRNIIQYATGQIAAKPEYLLPPATETEKWICGNLMVRSTVYQSFSIFALVVILVIGLGVILLSLWIEDVAAWMGQWVGGSGSKHMGTEVWPDDWKDHDMLGEQAWREKVGRSEGEEKDDVVPRDSSSLRSSDRKTEADGGIQHEGRGQLCSSQRVSAQALSKLECERLRIERACGSWI